MDGLVVNEARLGYDHVTAQEQATANMSLLGGKGNYLDPYYGNKCTMTMVSANILQISTGAMWVNGHNMQITSPITVPIANGQVGFKRKDLICVHLNTSDFGTINAIDNFDIVAVQGISSTGTPEDPTLTVDHITHDVQESWSAIGRVNLDGLTPTAELLLQTLPALLITPDRIEPNSIGKDQLETAVWDSISHNPFLAQKVYPTTYRDFNKLPIGAWFIDVDMANAPATYKWCDCLVVGTESSVRDIIVFTNNGIYTRRRSGSTDDSWSQWILS